MLAFTVSAIQPLVELRVGVKLNPFSCQLPRTLSNTRNLGFSVSSLGKVYLGSINLSKQKSILDN
jgi:hypothetical protein